MPFRTQTPSSSSVRVRFLDGPKVIQTLREMAEQLFAQDPQVEQVLLFGSLAKGNYSARSDADLCIILRDDARPELVEGRPMDRIPEFLGRFSGAPVPVDLLVYTRAEVEQRLREGNRFVAEVLTNGIRLTATQVGESTAGR